MKNVHTQLVNKSRSVEMNPEKLPTKSVTKFDLLMIYFQKD